MFWLKLVLAILEAVIGLYFVIVRVDILGIPIILIAAANLFL